jgi:hypothetical protein
MIGHYTYLLDEAVRLRLAYGDEWHAHMDPELLQWLAVENAARDRDTPAKVWSQAKEAHPAIYKFLRIDPAEQGARYAIDPFRVHMDPDTGKARILVAWPCPRLIDALDDYLVVEQVIEWAPMANTVTMLRDPSPQLAGTFTDREQGTLFADPFAFFRAWVEARAAWACEWMVSRRAAWRVRPIERDLVPGCLMLGAVDQIRWQPSDMPASLNCVGVDPRAVNRAILKAARLPMAINSRSPLRRAA